MIIQQNIAGIGELEGITCSDAWDSAEITPQGLLEGQKFGIRALAYVIDYLVLIVSTAVAGFPGGILIGILSSLNGYQPILDDQADRALVDLLQLFLGFGASVFYFTIFEWLYGATWGKLILGLRVVKETGAPCTAGSAFIRALLRFVDSLFFCLPALLTMKFPSYQRIGDKAAKTVVIRTEDVQMPQVRPWWWLLVAQGIFFACMTLLVILAYSMVLN